MKRMLICLVLVLGAGFAYADSQAPKPGKESKAKNGKTAVVTGSQIPTKVDSNGRPLKSTLKVEVVDEPSIRTFGLGSPVSTLQRVPYIYMVGGGGRRR